MGKKIFGFEEIFVKRCKNLPDGKAINYAVLGRERYDTARKIYRMGLIKRNHL